MATTTAPSQQQEKEEEQQGERKEDHATEQAANEKEEEGDECPICLEILPKDETKYDRFLCCGNGIHMHCIEDLSSMEVGRNCPLCRAKTPTSDEECVKLLRPWVKKKKAWAQNGMAEMYKDGIGVKQSYEMARRLYEQTAQQGDAGAMFNLGVMYHDGLGVEQSYEKAKEYFEQAAQLGYAGAQYNTEQIANV